MKKIKIIAVGKIKEDFFREGIAEYVKRLERFCCLTLVELSDSDREECALIEGKKILPEMEGGYNILLDISGAKMSSEKFADVLDKLFVNSSAVHFIIGGSRGVSDEVRKKADKLLSFSDMTFPHRLFRLMLTEQIYRAFSITAGLPYHK